MDPKKLALPDQVLSPKGKVLSWLVLWIGASLVLLSVLFLSSSLKSRVSVTPLLQGFNGFNAVNSSSLVSWPFSLSTSYSSSSVSRNNGTLEVMLDKAHMGNLTDNVSGSVSVGEGSVQEKAEKPKDGDFLYASGGNGNGSVIESTFSGNFSDLASNGSLHGEDQIFIGNFSITIDGNLDANRSIEGKSGENYSDVNGSVLDSNDKKGNLIFNEEFNRSSGGEEEKQAANFETCDIFDGGWVRDDSKPYYPASSCPHIDREFDCLLNGRPDAGFVKWKWQPNGCNIPSLNATDFLERLRGQTLVFVGDSINRNMWESLVCMLRHSIRNKKRVYEISGQTEFKKKGFYAFRFEDYNCSVDFVGSPFIVRESSFDGKNGTLETLRLDLMDQTTKMYQDADIIVFNTGHWWTHEKTSRGENYYQEGNYVHPRLKVLEAYKRALLTWARWVDKSIDSSRTQIFFRGYSATHFRRGQWNSGGQCHQETEPILNTTHLKKYPSKMRALEHVLEEMRSPVIYLNISRLTDYRKDGHPSMYRMQYKTAEERLAAEQSQDCSHWCLPGVPDAWNELLYASLLKAGRGSWRT